MRRRGGNNHAGATLVAGSVAAACSVSVRRVCLAWAEARARWCRKLRVLAITTDGGAGCVQMLGCRGLRAALVLCAFVSGADSFAGLCTIHALAREHHAFPHQPDRP